jgi:hypothetical protein
MLCERERVVREGGRRAGRDLQLLMFDKSNSLTTDDDADPCPQTPSNQTSDKKEADGEIGLILKSLGSQRLRDDIDVEEPSCGIINLCEVKNIQFFQSLDHDFFLLTI